MIRLVPRLVTKNGINNVFRLKQHSLEKTNGRIPADFVLIKRFLSSNSLSPSAELTDDSSAVGEDLSKLDNVYSSDDNTNQQQQGDVPFVTYTQNNPPQVVYDFFKRLVYSQRSVQSRSVLTGVLKGVLAGNFCSEFSSYYFEAWWKDYVNFLENPSTNHPFLITNLNNLGKINKLTNGEMGKMYFNAKVFQFLDAKFGQIEFEKLSAEAVFSYFRGISNLVDEQRIFNVKLISKETIAQTMNFFKANFASNTTPTFVNAYASFLNCLAKFGCVLNKSDFQVLVEYFKTTVFDDASFASSSSSSVDEKLSNLKKSVTYDEFAIKCRAIYNFGEAFLQFGLNPDVFATDVLSSWFACWKRLLSIDMKMVEYVRGLSDSERRLNQRLSATEIIKLCDVAAQLSTRFGKQIHFLDSLELWNDVMEKNIFPASMHTVVPFSNTMHVTALNFTAVAKLDSNFYFSGAPSALLSDTAVQSMLSKVQNEHDFKRKSILMQQEQAIRLGRNDQRKIRFSYRDAASDENKHIRITQQP